MTRVTEDTLDEVHHPKKDSKKRGRPKNVHYLSWNEAREAMRSEMLPSRGKFFDWWDRNKPKVIPRFPYRVYQEEWTSWNDFLGTNNKFNDKVGIKWRPMVEANAWSIKHGLKSQSEWLEFCRIEGNLPEDIPARPDLVYDEWRSWGHWLGNRPVEAIEAKQEIAQKVHIYYIIHESDVPGNVLTFGIEPGGQSVLKARWETERFDVVRMFWYDHSKADIIKQIVESLSSPYTGYERQRIVPNVWEIVWHLQMHLEMITRPSA
jgi:hypothetical protein